LSLFYNDVDLCKRLWQQGRRIHYLASAEVMHHRGGSTRNFARMLVLWHRNRLAYYGKHYGWLGRLWIRICVRLRIWEELRRIRSRHANDPGAQAAERAYLRAAQRELWAD
jgi:GT2 family glycosyltransferase